MTIKLMESEVHINWEMICQIIFEDLGKKKICRKFVPHSLKDELIQASLEMRHGDQPPTLFT